jgi:hypothetical protein
MHAHVAALLEESRHLVGQAWPGGSPPTPVRESLRRLERAAEQLEAAAGPGRTIDEGESRRLATLAAKAGGEAASIQEAAFLVSS